MKYFYAKDTNANDVIFCLATSILNLPWMQSKILKGPSNTEPMLSRYSQWHCTED